MYPFFHILGTKVYTYPILVGFAWGLYLNLGLNYFLNNRLKFLFFWLMNFVFGWLGAKLLFLIVAPKYLQDNLIENSNFWLGGGFVFYGGFISCCLFSLIYIKFQNKDFKESIRNTVYLFPLSHGIGRIACFLAGCCYGKKMSWGIQMHGDPRIPTALLEALFLFCLSWVLKKYHWNFKNKIRVYFFSYAFWRFVIEFLRADEIRGFYHGLSTSQIISLFLLFASITLEFKKPFKS
jgi:phosphatidylglycerol:prolipoprotein diacylglycerol transferase